MVVSVGDQLHARGSGMSVDEHRTQVEEERANARHLFENMRKNAVVIEALRGHVQRASDDELHEIYQLPARIVRRAADGVLDPDGAAMKTLTRLVGEMAARASTSAVDDASEAIFAHSSPDDVDFPY
jgi:hypothetical protein